MRKVKLIPEISGSYGIFIGSNNANFIGAADRGGFTEAQLNS
jgi:hypothetical protein